MNSKLRQQAIDLRLKNRLSYSEIKQRLNIPKNTLSYWLKEFPLSNEEIGVLRLKGWTRSETSREIFRETMRKKKEEKAQKLYKYYSDKLKGVTQESYFVAGLMLYIAEGDKKNDTRIVLVNTDPKIIKFFIKWLNDFLDVPTNNIKVQLHLYENMNIESEKNFWIFTLGLHTEQLYKPYLGRLKTASFSYKGLNRHGTCSIFVLGVERKLKLMMAIQAFIDNYLK